MQELRERILVLEQQIDWFNRQLFGRKSEKHVPGQHPDLFSPAGLGKPETSCEGQTQEDSAPSKPKARKSRKIRAQAIPAHLPTTTTYHDPEEYLRNPDAFRLLKEERRYRIGKTPGHFYRKEEVYRTWVPVDNSTGGKALVAKAPPTLIPNGFWEPDLIAEVIANRYLYHLPYDRQQKLYQNRHGIHLPKQTMSDAAYHLGTQAKALTDLMKRDMLKCGYIRADETEALYLDKTEPGGSSKGRMWLYKSLNGNVLFDWQLTREHHHFFHWIGDDFEGIIGTDAYEAYLQYRKIQQARGKKVKRAACLAHIRRKFEEALKQKPHLARWYLKIFGKLYQIEATLKDLKADPAAKARYRKKHSLPLLKLIHRASLYLRDRKAARPAGRLGKAISYTLNQWEDVPTYIDHGQVEIDNNGIERDVRPLAVGRKNWLFIGSPEAGERSAVIYSLLISARHHGVDPELYLHDLIKRLPTCGSDEKSLRELLPENWAAAYQAAQQTEAQESAAA